MIAHPNQISRTHVAADQPNNSPNEFADQFSETSFWQKLRGFARIAGREVTEKALFLYYALSDPSMPGWAKGVVYGALGYFILPADAIPDVFPGIGFTDDLGALTAAIAVVLVHVTPEVKAKARRHLEVWFQTSSAAAG